MNLTNKIELRLEKYEKCVVLVDADCPLGQLYDYACAVQSFCIQKMKEAQDSQKQTEEKPVDQV